MTLNADKYLAAFVFILLLTLTANVTRAQENSPSFRTSQYNIEKTVAIQGYDPVSYFKAGKPVKGKESLRISHEGITYLFSSQQNLDLFKKSPSAYEPKYGGWCAYAMGNTGDKVEVDPETFKIIDGKLFLFYNAYLNKHPQEVE